MCRNETTPDGYRVGPGGIWGESTEPESSDDISGRSTPQRKTEKNETGKTIADILPEDFPTTADDAWRIDNDPGRSCYVTEEDGEKILLFACRTAKQSGDYTYRLSYEVTETDGNYECAAEDGGWVISFIFSEGALEEIRHDFHRYWPCDAAGAYRPQIPPAPPYTGPTIADVLPDDFPYSDSWDAVPGDAWAADNGNRCINGWNSCLCFHHIDPYGSHVVQFPFDAPVTQDGDNYVWGDGGIIFIMTDGVLERIENYNCVQEGGIFTPPQKTNGSQRDETPVIENDNDKKEGPEQVTAATPSNAQQIEVIANIDSKDPINE